MFICVYAKSAQARSGLYNKVVTRCQATSSRNPRDTASEKPTCSYPKSSHIDTLSVAFNVYIVMLGILLRTLLTFQDTATNAWTSMKAHG